MDDAQSLAASREMVESRGWLYYGWVNVVMAAIAMTATLPGRTHGLGLITEPLIAELGISRSLFAEINLVATLLGAAFCLPIGWCIDRFGVRSISTGIILSLAVAVWTMTGIRGSAALFICLILVRGLGQSALSIASIAMVSKWFRRRLGLAMGVFAVLLTFGFIGTILAVGDAVVRWGWREAWQAVALSLAVFAPFVLLFVRSSPPASGRDSDEVEPTATPAGESAHDFTLREALRTPAFWVFALGTAAFNLVWTGITLFNEAILAERGFDTSTAVMIMAILTGCGLVANLVAGALCTRERLGRLLSFGLLVLAVGLIAFPNITQLWQLHCYAVAIGLSGGIVTVIFFTAWSHLFGKLHVGKIVGASQLLTVTASALGPVCISHFNEAFGSFAPAFRAMAAGVAVLAVCALFVKLPQTAHFEAQGS